MVKPSTAAESESWQQRWRRLWIPPDPDLVDAGLRGEWLVAGIRLLIVLLLLYIPLAQYLESPLERGRQIVLWVAVAALSEALVVYAAVKRSWGRGWIGFFSGVLDVSLVTLCLWIFIRLGQPLAATNDLVLYPMYFLAIGATSLRYDWRICMLTGLFAIFEYSLLVFYAVWQWDLDELPGEPFSWGAQLGRLALLAVATLLAVTLVVRALEQRRLSNRDRLTGVANRGFFDESIDRLGALASRSGESVGVVMMDIDHFKRFNDTYGHLAGDKVLKKVAATISGWFRTTDLIARYGGEEFAGLFPGMSLDDAERRFEDLRARIEETRVAIDSAGGLAQVTVSMGVAVWPQDGLTLMETLAIADLRLYQAKEAGRNRIVASVPGRVPARQEAASLDVEQQRS